MGYHQNYAIVSHELIDKLVEVKGGYGLEGAYRHIRIKPKSRDRRKPEELAGKAVIVDMCRDKSKAQQSHPILGSVPRFVIYLREMTNQKAAQGIVRELDIWRCEDDVLFELPENHENYGKSFWSHSLSLYDDYGPFQLPRLVIFHPVLRDNITDGYFNYTEEIGEALRENAAA